MTADKKLMSKKVPTARPVESSTEGVILRSKPNLDSMSSRIVEDERVFDTLIHETEVHTPEPVLDISADPGVQGELTDCLDMPIRLKGQTDYALPQNWLALENAIQQIIDVEHTNNPSWQDYYTYLSVHYTPDLEPGEQQRHAGCHTDGFQGAREPVRTKTSRSYVAVTNGGTRFFPQTFVANLDPSEFNVFEGFDLQVEKDEHGKPNYGVAKENMFYFFDAYTVHESGAASRPGPRLFMRLTWEMKLFDRAGNTKNRMLNYNWAPVDYDVRSSLRTPATEDIEKARLVR